MTAAPSMPNAIVPYNMGALDNVKMLKNLMTALRYEVFIKGVDFGEIPGTNKKDNLLLPGMEKITRALNAKPVYRDIMVIRDYDRPLFHFEFECSLVDLETGKVVPGGVGLGLCTSMESSFAWRWVQAHEVPAELDPAKLMKRGGRTSEPAFAIEKAETGGKYGKPAEYWQMFKDAIAKGTAMQITRQTAAGKPMDAWEIDTTVYRIPNPDIFDQVNTILKRAKKRALGDAVKGAANVSELFTVDLEDYLEVSGMDTIIVEGGVSEVKTTPIAVAPKADESPEEAPKPVEATPAPAFDKSKWDTVSAKAWLDARLGNSDFNEPTRDDIYNALKIKNRLSEFKGGGWDAADAALKAYFGTPVDQRYAPVRDVNARLGKTGAKLGEFPAGMPAEAIQKVNAAMEAVASEPDSDLMDAAFEEIVGEDDELIEDNIQDLATPAPARQWYEPKPESTPAPAPVAPAAPPAFKKDDMKTLLVEGRVHMQQYGKSANSVRYSFPVIGDLNAPDGVPDKRIEFAECMSRQVFAGTKIDTSKWPKDDPKVQTEDGLWFDLGWKAQKVTFTFECEYNGKGGWIIKGVSE